MNKVTDSDTHFEESFQNIQSKNQEAQSAIHKLNENINLQYNKERELLKSFEQKQVNQHIQNWQKLDSLTKESNEKLQEQQRIFDREHPKHSFNLCSEFKDRILQPKKILFSGNRDQIPSSKFHLESVSLSTKSTFGKDFGSSHSQNAYISSDSDSSE